VKSGGGNNNTTVDSHGQTRGTKIYTLRVDNEHIHPRLKVWFSVWLAFSGTRGSIHGCWKLYSEYHEHEGEAQSRLWRDGGGDASPGNRNEKIGWE